MTDDGIMICKDIAITNFFSEDRITTYICRVCGATFQPVKTDFECGAD